MKWLKVGAVVFVSVVLTTLAIDAADTLNGSGSTLLGQLISSEQSVCPLGMIPVPAATTFTCVDTYEAAAGPDCPHQNPANFSDSGANATALGCNAVSKADTLPWRFVTREQAVTACLRSGKRLISSDEWFTIAAGTPDTDSCNIHSGGARVSGADKACVSAVGVYDTVGNVWEWTTNDVIAGKHEGVDVPAAGYVSQVDSGGFPLVSTAQSNSLFADDYFWSSPEGAYGVLRGGYYGSESDAGVYSVHAQTLPTNASAAIGFRCVS